VLAAAVSNAGSSQEFPAPIQNGGAQNGGIGDGDVTQRFPHRSGDEGPGPAQQKALQDQQEKRHAARQQELVADAEKLLKLATELKIEVDKSNKDTLSVTVIKKSEEIEKLAKSVKDKMKNPI
jgi:type VI protein secretion system component VasF